MGFLRRLVLVVGLVVVSLLVLTFAAVMFPALPWWAWIFAGLFWVLLIRKIRAGRDLGPVDEAGPRFSPLRDRGGY